MIIYSPVPAEVIWQNMDEPQYKLIDHVINGVPVQIRLINRTEARVERILSTDPQDYLYATCQPGQSILTKNC